MDFLLVIWFFPRLGVCCMVCWSVAWFHCLLRGLGLEGRPLVHLVYLVGWDFHSGFLDVTAGVLVREMLTSFEVHAECFSIVCAR